MTEAESNTLKAKVDAEWAAMDAHPEEKAAYQGLGRAVKRRKRADQEAAAAAPQAPAQESFRGLWGSSSVDGMPIDASDLAHFSTTDECKRDLAKAAVAENPDIISSVPTRVAGAAHCPGLVWVCYNMHKNCCRIHDVK